MKTKFSWFLPPSQEECDTIWNEGILTLDANVLLDLYRVHCKTRNTMITAIKSFSGRLWLTNQAANEFINNVRSVEFNSKKIYIELCNYLDKIDNSIKSNIDLMMATKVLEKDKLNKFIEDYKKLSHDIKKYIKDNEKSHLNELKNNSILDFVSSYFNNKVGSDIPQNEIVKWNEEAEQRIKNKIPPGFMDENKKMDKSYGDYYLWKQLLRHAKEKSKPIILVTSEEKEDWWQKQSDNIIGPRIELLKEAFEESGQRILIYRTDYFIKKYGDRSSSVVRAEIRDAIEEFKNLYGENKLVYIIKQNIEYADINVNSGTITVKLKHPARYFTVSGHLQPNMINIPKIKATLVGRPENTPEYYLSFGTGTLYDFNIHIKSVGASYLHEGEYTFAYNASCEDKASS